MEVVRARSATGDEGNSLNWREGLPAPLRQERRCPGPERMKNENSNSTLKTFFMMENLNNAKVHKMVFQTQVPP